MSKGSFAEFALATKVPDRQSVLADIFSPAQMLSRTFKYQSYFDSTLREKALIQQPRNEPIVDVQETQMSGYAIGLHPDSEAPVAVQFLVGGQGSSSAPLLLKPGQIVRPHGLPKGLSSGSFSGFRYGLPFGWLGGGNVTLFVFQTADAKANWIDNTEVIFHRARYVIKAGAGALFNTPNWPMRFPWVNALYGTNSVPQSGQPVIAIARPSRILVTVRLTSLADPGGTIRMYVQGSQDFGLDSAGDPIVTEAVFTEIPVPGYAVYAGVPVAGFPTFEITGPAARLAADDGTVEFVSELAALQGATVDVVRYGYL